MSGMSNVLMLIGAIFMMQVYDRILPSHSSSTLVLMSILVVSVYVFICGVDLIRSRMFSRLARLHSVKFGNMSFDLAVNQPSTSRSSPLADLERIRAFIGGGGLVALYDLPWLSLYGCLLFILDVRIGMLGVFGVVALALIGWPASLKAAPLQLVSSERSVEALAIVETMRRKLRTIEPLGMADVFKKRWAAANARSALSALESDDYTARFASVSRWIRMSLQSLVLALAAYLTIIGEASAGVIVASSILLGRALAPLKSAIAQIRSFSAARQAYVRLKEQLKPAQGYPPMELPLPKDRLTVHRLTVRASSGGRLLLKGVDFQVEAGDAVAILGKSGSGKSTLLRAIVGGIPIESGSVQVDGSCLDQWPAAKRRRFLGYLPQEVDLFAGSLASNVASLESEPDAAAVLSSCEATDLDEYIRGLSDGYNTEIGDGGDVLSAGFRQRVALARAVYGEPFLLVLDEPNASLDNEGEKALNAIILRWRERGGIVLIASHRQNVLQHANKVLVLAGGRQVAFGHRDAQLAAGNQQPSASPT